MKGQGGRGIGQGIGGARQHTDEPSSDHTALPHYCPCVHSTQIQPLLLITHHPHPPPPHAPNNPNTRCMCLRPPSECWVACCQATCCCSQTLVWCQAMTGCCCGLLQTWGTGCWLLLTHPVGCRADMCTCKRWGSVFVFVGWLQVALWQQL